MSATIIILACNNLPDINPKFNENTDPLRSRIGTNIIKFEKFPKHKQRVIANNSFEKELDRRNKSLEISDENALVLSQSVDKNPKPGVRELKEVVDKYVHHINNRSLKNVEFDIDKAYGIKPKKNEAKVEEIVEKKDEPDTQMMMNAIICELYTAHIKKKEDELASDISLQDKGLIEIQNQSNFNNINDDNRDS
jgi:hypothetical protein